MCEEESDDAEAVHKLLEINDSIHRTIERYKLMKAGDINAANNIPKGTLGTTTGVGRNSANELSLIDFDPEPEPASGKVQPASQAVSNGSLLEDLGSESSSSKQTTVEDDLLGLSLGGPGSTGSIALGGSSTPSNFFAAPAPSPRPQQPAQPAFAATSQPPTQASKSNYDAFASLSSALPRSKPATPTPGQQRPTQPQPAIDPFAALVSSSSRPGTPSTQQNGRATSGAFKPSGMGNVTAPTAPAASAPTAAEDDWDFVSSPPAQEPSLPPKSNFVVHESGKLKVTFECMRQTNASQAIPPIYARASFTNQTSTPISGLNFQVAVEKAYSLQLQPQSGKDLAPQQSNAVTQNMLVQNVPQGKGTSVRIRFKASYLLGGVPQEEQGMISSLQIA